MTARPAFKITERQVRDLVAITPPGHVAELRVAFVPKTVASSEPKTTGKTCDELFETGQSG